MMNRRDISDNTRSIVSGLLAHFPEERLSMADVLRSPWFDDRMLHDERPRHTLLGSSSGGLSGSYAHNALERYGDVNRRVIQELGTELQALSRPRGPRPQHGSGSGNTSPRDSDIAIEERMKAMYFHDSPAFVPV